VTRRKPSQLITGRLQLLRLFSTLLPISLINPVLSEIAFHEEAGRSQVFFCSLDKVFLLPSGPLSLPFHPHSC
jgi:hypothetical protein